MTSVQSTGTAGGRAEGRSLFDAPSYADWVRGAMRIELGIQLLLDQRVSDRMIELLTQSAAIAARDAAELAPGQV